MNRSWRRLGEATTVDGATDAEVPAALGRALAGDADRYVRGYAFEALGIAVDTPLLSSDEHHVYVGTRYVLKMHCTFAKFP